MPVRVPAAGSNVHFHIPAKGRIAAHLHDGVTEIRSALDAAKTRMKNAQGLTVQGLELVAPQALVLPDGLQQPFGRRFAILVQDRRHAAADAPLRIKTGWDRRRHAIAFALILRQSQAPDAPAGEN
jgi:hypothetical protein